MHPRVLARSVETDHYGRQVARRLLSNGSTTHIMSILLGVLVCACFVLRGLGVSVFFTSVRRISDAATPVLPTSTSAREAKRNKII